MGGGQFRLGGDMADLRAPVVVHHQHTVAAVPDQPPQPLCQALRIIEPGDAEDDLQAVLLCQGVGAFHAGDKTVHHFARVLVPGVQKVGLHIKYDSRQTGDGVPRLPVLLPQGEEFALNPAVIGSGLLDSLAQPCPFRVQGPRGVSGQLIDRDPSFHSGLQKSGHMGLPAGLAGKILVQGV